MLVCGTPLKDFFKQERRPRVQWISANAWRKFQMRGAKRMTSMSARISNLRTLHKAWLENPSTGRQFHLHTTLMQLTSRSVQRKLFLLAARHSLEQHLCTHQFLTRLLSKDLTSHIHRRSHISRESNRSEEREERVLEQTSVNKLNQFHFSKLNREALAYQKYSITVDADASGILQGILSS